MISPELGTLIKHRRGMMLLDKVLAHDDNAITTQVIISENSTFFEIDHVPAWVGVEYSAQSVAALSGLTASKMNEESKLGLLLSCRNYKSSRSRFEAGETLIISAEEEFNDGHMGVYRSSIYIESKAIASLTLSAYIPDNINHIKTLGRKMKRGSDNE